MVHHHITSQLLALSAAEKSEVIRLLIQSISDQWTGIEKTPDVCGGSARVANTRIPVWVIVQARNLGSSDAEVLQDYPTLSANDLVNAWAYANSHKAEIEQNIHENEEA